MSLDAGPEPVIPEPAPPIELPVISAPVAPPAPPKRRAQLYSPTRRGYKRSTMEEGVHEELKVMQEEAAGSPFYDAPLPVKSQPEVSKETQRLLDKLRGLKK